MRARRLLLVILLSVTACHTATPVAEGRPGLHDHTPHHGGVVAMVGMIHLETVATAEGRVRVYLSDIWRRPLPLAGVDGSVTIRLPEGKQTLPLFIAGDALEASGPRLRGPGVSVEVDLTRGDNRLR